MLVFGKGQSAEYSLREQIINKKYTGIYFKSTG